ncbi:hypothetical protein [Seinonella peptonophila]|nr:hypothetical protein [Seinonella peptonophila]
MTSIVTAVLIGGFHTSEETYAAEVTPSIKTEGALGQITILVNAAIAEVN